MGTLERTAHAKQLLTNSTENLEAAMENHSKEEHR
jgi:hypothetical protein